MKPMPAHANAQEPCDAPPKPGDTCKQSAASEKDDIQQRTQTQSCIHQYRAHILLCCIKSSMKVVVGVTSWRAAHPRIKHGCKRQPPLACAAQLACRHLQTCKVTRSGSNLVCVASSPAHRPRGPRLPFRCANTSCCWLLPTRTNAVPNPATLGATCSCRQGST